MYIHDYRLGKILSHVRIQEARQQRLIRAHARSGIRNAIGRLLIATGQRLVHGETSTVGESAGERVLDMPSLPWTPKIETAILA
jgi:hypothetical protein